YHLVDTCEVTAHQRLPLFQGLSWGGGKIFATLPLGVQALVTEGDDHLPSRQVPQLREDRVGDAGWDVIDLLEGQAGEEPIPLGELAADEHVPVVIHLGTS